MDNQQIINELHALKRRQDSIEAGITLLNKDRNMLEDILSRLTQVEIALNLNKDHQTEMQQNIKQDIAHAQQQSNNKVEEIKKVINEQTVVVKTGSENLFKMIWSKLKGSEKK